MLKLTSSAKISRDRPVTTTEVGKRISREKTELQSKKKRRRSNPGRGSDKRVEVSVIL